MKSNKPVLLAGCVAAAAAVYSFFIGLSEPLAEYSKFFTLFFALPAVAFLSAFIIQAVQKSGSLILELHRNEIELDYSSAGKAKNLSIAGNFDDEQGRLVKPEELRSLLFSHWRHFHGSRLKPRLQLTISSETISSRSKSEIQVLVSIMEELAHVELLNAG